MADITDNDMIDDPEDDLGPDPDELEPPDANPVAPANEDDLPMTRGQAREILAKLQAQPASAEPAAPSDNPLGSGSPDASVFEVRRQMGLIDSMVADVRAKNPDAPLSVLDGLRKELDKFQTYDQLVAVQKQGNHQRWADAQLMSLLRDGKYVPKSLRGKGGVAASDIGSGGAVSNPVRRQSQLSQVEREVESIERRVLEEMGVKLDDDDLNYLATGGRALR